MANNQPDIKKLGFGYMRLPLKNGRFDSDTVNAMVDRFLKLGFTYFDTAFIYEGSEDALRESLVERYPRDSFQIATKLAVFAISDPTKQREQLEMSLKRLGTDFIDYYLIHGLGGESIKTADRLDSWGYMRSVKEQGLARHIGFSFHGTPDELDGILTNHPEMEFVQLQINYLDWENPEVRSRELYEIARRHGKPISVMEPTKGGLLAGQDSTAGDVLKAADPSVSVASWAFRFIWSLDGIMVALSGMENLDQINDNAATFEHFTPLTPDERAKIEEAAERIREAPRVPCTSCRYCTSHCPQKIQIPTYIGIYNNMLAFRDTNSTGYSYSQNSFPGMSTPADCIKCKACEEHCPQHIEISQIMDNFTAKLEEVRAKFRVN
ncbi:MAG: aldo/keto reductase [Oscillospiraceae bacterium]|nr:aldo/keto reductase [Oscillospiraceae bacterium]